MSMKKFCRWLLLSACLFLAGQTAVFADDYVSTNFILRDPVFHAEGDYATSSNFQYFSSTAEISVGSSTATSFIARFGFLYFPVITTPVVSASAGNAQVSLTWTASDAALGFTVSGYRVGQSTVSGGPYSFTSVGNVLASTRTGLTNGTAYYFVVGTLDGLGNNIATSTEVLATPVASPPPPPPAPPPPPGGGGGGGGGGGPAPTGPATVNFSGRAYPQSVVTLLQDAQIVVQSIAGPDARFQFGISGLSPGTYIFALYTQDAKGNRSGFITFPITVTAGATVNVTGIFFSPTIAVDKDEVRRGDNIAIFGQSTPNANIVIEVNSLQQEFVQTLSDATGVYLYNFDTSPLDIGDHSTKSKASFAGGASPFSSAVGFRVGTASILPPPTGAFNRKGDFNHDGRVNLVDFSILAYWYRRPLTLAAKQRVDLNGDGAVTFVDFSILAFYWTG